MCSTCAAYECLHMHVCMYACMWGVCEQHGERGPEHERIAVLRYRLRVAVARREAHGLRSGDEGDGGRAAHKPGEDGLANRQAGRGGPAALRTAAHHLTRPLHSTHHSLHSLLSPPLTRPNHSLLFFPSFTVCLLLTVCLQSAYCSSSNFLFFSGL